MNSLLSVPATRSALFAFLLLIVWAGPAIGQRPEVNYDESKMPKFELPDPLLGSDGKRITSPQQWPARRAEILKAFSTEVYGQSPPKPESLHWKLIEQSDSALGGIARRRQVRVFFDRDERVSMDMLIYLPADTSAPRPAFLALNFKGNQSIQEDPSVLLSQSWMRASNDGTVQDHRATEASRGCAASRWPVKLILSRGYALATIYYGDIDPDFDDGFQNGVHQIYGAPQADGWGSIATWAWGLSRAMDYLENDNEIDAKRVAVMGHSRLGKTALWAGAVDQRFAITISNDSGCGGAALSRRAIGETVKRINTSFPHWFCTQFKKYNDNENACPVDQHMLLALIAPRPVYVASAQEDQWADPRGEFLSVTLADPVYRLLGTEGIGPVEHMPPINQPVMHTMGYHIRSGKHDVTEFDWKAYLEFADRTFSADSQGNSRADTDDAAPK